MNANIIFELVLVCGYVWESAVDKEVMSEDRRLQMTHSICWYDAIVMSIQCFVQYKKGCIRCLYYINK